MAVGKSDMTPELAQPFFRETEILYYAPSFALIDMFNRTDDRPVLTLISLWHQAEKD